MCAEQRPAVAVPGDSWLQTVQHSDRRWGLTGETWSGELSTLWEPGGPTACLGPVVALPGVRGLYYQPRAAVLDRDHRQQVLVTWEPVPRPPRSDPAPDAQASASLDRYVSAFHGAAVGIAVATLDGWFTLVNAAFCSITGYSSDELLEMNFLAITHPLDRAVCLERVHSMAQGQQTSIVLEKRYLHKQGHAVWVRASVSTIAPGGGPPQRVVALVQDISELRQQADRLVEREQFLRGIYEGVPHPVCVVDVDRAGRFAWVDCNPAARTLLMIAEDAEFPLNGEGIARELLSTGLARLKRCAAEGTPQVFEDVVHLGGRSTHWLTTVTPLCDSEGRVWRIVGTSSDITALKQAEQALRASETKLRTLLANLPDIVSIVDREAVVRYANRTPFPSISPERILNKPARLHVPEADQPALASVLSSVLEQGRTAELEHAGPRGTWYHTRMVPLEQHDQVMALSISTDVTERRRMLEALRESSELLRAVVYSAPIAVNMVDSEGRVRLWNPACEALLGWSSAEVSGRIPAWIPEEKQSEFERLQLGITRGQGQIDLETVRRRRDGSLVEVALSIAPLRDAHDRLIGSLGMMCDLTARRQAEQQAEQHRRELTHAARISLLGQMLAGIAHEVNQPLYAISNYAHACRQLLDRGGDANPEISDWIANISQQAVRASEIVRRLAGTVRPNTSEPLAIDVGALLQNTGQLAAFEANHEQIELTVEVSQDLPRVVCDRVALEQVLMNLLRNAFDAVAPLPPERRQVRLWARHSDAGQLVLGVTDLGVGIEAERIDAIFSPFHTTKPNGLGLGLAISKSLVEAQQGTLQVRANSDHGVTFLVTLPSATREALS